MSQNPETSCGIMSMAGRKPEIFITQTRDIGKLLVAVQQIQIGGQTDIATSIKIAYLSLKNRQNKAQKPRIVLFTCSPLPQESKELVQLGKKMKKNGCAIDIVNFGHPENTPKLTELINAVNSSNNSHLVEVGEYSSNIADALITSPIINDQVDDPMNGGAAPAEGGQAQPQRFAEYGGVDPSLDPELANAIRISLEEAKKQEQQN